MKHLTGSSSGSREADSAKRSSQRLKDAFGILEGLLGRFRQKAEWRLYHVGEFCSSACLFLAAEDALSDSDRVEGLKNRVFRSQCV